VTVLANFWIFALFSLSQSKSEYISRTLFPSCLLVKVVETTSLLSNRVLTVGLLGPTEIVPDRLGRVPDWFFGVLLAEFGLWYAYVMKRARDRKTSAVIVHLTRLVRASIKDGNTS
jgi:hypothetical protein